MPTACLFCENPAGNREHLWPKWIHERKNFGPIRHKIGNRPEKIVGDPEQTIKTVCSVCNNGWMSQLEDENKPIIASMFSDLTIPLDEGQQALRGNRPVEPHVNALIGSKNGHGGRFGAGP